MIHASLIDKISVSPFILYSQIMSYCIFFMLREVFKE